MLLTKCFGLPSCKSVPRSEISPGVITHIRTVALKEVASGFIYTEQHALGSVQEPLSISRFLCSVLLINNFSLTSSTVGFHNCTLLVSFYPRL